MSQRPTRKRVWRARAAAMNRSWLLRARLGLLSRLHPLPENFQLDDTQCSFNTQHRLIIQVTQIVNLLFVSDEGSKNPADFDKPAPILVGTGKP